LPVPFRRRCVLCKSLPYTYTPKLDDPIIFHIGSYIMHKLVCDLIILICSPELPNSTLVLLLVCAGLP
jgi:hypothetical protein